MIFDFRLKVFYTVSQKLSFTKAAQELFITQPAVTKHIKELEDQIGIAVFKRNGNSIELTPAGKVLVKYAEQIFKMYASLENELAQLVLPTSGHLRIGASTTLANYVLPRIIALFKTAHPAIHLTFVSGNSDLIEHQLIDEKIDLGITEGDSHHPQIMYEPFAKDEIVLVANPNSKLAQKGEIKASQLSSIPLVLREHGSGTLDIVAKALAQHHIGLKDLKVEIQMESTESHKHYVMHTESAAFLSIHAIAKELKDKELSVVEIKGIEIARTFQFIHLHGNTSPLLQLFKRFCLNHYNL